MGSVLFEACSLSSLIGEDKPQLQTVVVRIILSLSISKNTPPFHLGSMVLVSKFTVLSER